MLACGATACLDQDESSVIDVLALHLQMNAAKQRILWLCRSFVSRERETHTRIMGSVSVLHSRETKLSLNLIIIRIEGPPRRRTTSSNAAMALNNRRAPFICKRKRSNNHIIMIIINDDGGKFKMQHADPHNFQWTRWNSGCSHS